MERLNSDERSCWEEAGETFDALLSFVRSDWIARKQLERFLRCLRKCDCTTLQNNVTVRESGGTKLDSDYCIDSRHFLVAWSKGRKTTVLKCRGFAPIGRMECLEVLI